MNASTSRSIRTIPSAIFDAAYAAALTAFGWLSLAARSLFFLRVGGGGGRRPPGSFMPAPSGAAPTPGVLREAPSLLHYGLVAAAFLPLALRRRFPLAVLAFVTGVEALSEYLHSPPSLLVFLAPLIALYTVGTLRNRRTLVTATALASVVLLAVQLPAFTDARFWAEFVRIVSMLGVAAAIGDATRNRRAYVAEVEQRAAEAERSRDEVARRRVDEERLRIARELHDVTAHSLSIIAVQSGAASHVLDSDPAEARRALEAIRRTSKEALDELRAMLGVLRSADDAGAPLAPVPGLARLAELTAQLEAAGVTVKLELEGDLHEMPALVDSSAYRIVQEALTNVVRHAGRCDALVAVRRDADALEIEVADTGRGIAGDGVSGHGLAGMRERAYALGGTFEAGPVAGGGFRVLARLPLAGRGGRS